MSILFLPDCPYVLHKNLISVAVSLLKSTNISIAILPLEQIFKIWKCQLLDSLIKLS
jgi:hypothetical protein